MPKQGKNKVRAAEYLVLWLLTIVLPAILLVPAIDFLGERHFEYEKALAMATARNQINRFDHLLNCENFLDSNKNRLSQGLAQLKKPTNAGLKDQIKKNIGIMPIYAVFQQREDEKILSFVERRDDIKDCILPSKILFRRIFSELTANKFENTPQYERLLKNNRLQLQQMFKTVTTNTILKNRILSNFSFYLGGEIYFMILQMPEKAKISHAILVFRGKDISSNQIVAAAMSEVANTQVILRPLSFSRHTTRPEAFNSQALADQYGISMIYPANQYFIRHYHHQGGTRIEKAPEKVPFIRHRIRFSSLRSSLLRMRKAIRAGSIVFVVFFTAIFLRFSIFGLEFSKSLKQRILAGIFAAAIFPVGMLCLCLFLYQGFDNLISQLNLVQHIELKIAQNFEQLVQRNKQIEMFMNNNKTLLQKLDGIEEVEFSSLIESLGKVLPFSEASYITEKNNFHKSFPERRSIFNMNAEDPIWSFFPNNVLRWAKEDGRKNRVAQHYFNVAGQTLKASFFNDSMMQYGGFYLISQGAVPIWVSSIRVYSKQFPEQISGIMHLKYELGPILHDFYQSKTRSEEVFYEELGNHRIHYGYFPLKLVSNNDFWQGSCASEHRDLFSEFLQNDQIQNIAKADGSQVFIRTNQGFKHKIIAIAQRLEKSDELGWIGLMVPSLIFIFLVLIFASRLLDHFFLQPINSMANCAEKIARGSEEWSLKISTGDELENLNQNFTEMLRGLQQRNALKEFVSADAFSEIQEKTSLELYPGGEYQEVSVLFASVKSQTEETDSSPEKIIARMNTFLSLCSKCSMRNSGIIDKIVEDTIMIIFRSGDNLDHSLNAARAALEIRNEVSRHDLISKIGIASGKVISGRIGSYTGKLDFTVIGDTVNLAARLKNEALLSSTGIIISGSMMRLLKGRARVNFLRRSSIKGKSREFNIYELVELR